MASEADTAGAIRQRARQLGFARVGFCEVSVPPPEAEKFEEWLEAGMHGTMAWMERGRAKRLDPSRVLPGARAMVVVAAPYPAGNTSPVPSRPTTGFVARYARGKDYHRILGERLARLERFIEETSPGARALAYVDTGPILERMWAARAGVGWIGKNALVLDEEIGSYFYLGVVLTTLPLPGDAPAVDRCGSCTLCLEACPTGAIVAPRLVDSRLCLSYHTIELRGPISETHRADVGTRLFGCDDCQEVCPYNHPSAGPSAMSEPDAGEKGPSLLEILLLSHEGYLERFRGSAIKRATWRGLRRNAAVALGNAVAGGIATAEERDVALAALERVASDESEDALVREHAAWASNRATEDT